MFEKFRNFQKKCLEFLRAKRAGRHLKMKPADREGGPRATLFRSKSLPSDYQGVKTGTYLKKGAKTIFDRRTKSEDFYGREAPGKTQTRNI